MLKDKIDKKNLKKTKKKLMQARVNLRSSLGTTSDSISFYQ